MPPPTTWCGGGRGGDWPASSGKVACPGSLTGYIDDQACGEGDDAEESLDRLHCADIAKKK